MKKDKGNFLEFLSKATNSVIFLSAAFLSSDICYLIVSKRDGGHKDVPPEILCLREKIFEYSVRLNKVLETDVEGRKDFIDELKNFENELTDIALHLKLYKLFFQIIDNMITEQMQKCTVMEDKPLGAELYYVMDKCIEYIDQTDIIELKAITMSNMLGCFPMKMSRSKFEDFVSRSFDILLSGTAKEFVRKVCDYYKYNFAPFAVDGFGKHLPKIGDKLCEIFDLDMDKLEYAELEEIDVRLSEQIQPAIDTAEFIGCILDCVNYLINLASLVNNKDDMLEENFLCRDLFFATCDLAANHEERVLLDEVSKRSDELLGEYREPSLSLIKKFYASVDKFDRIDLSEEEKQSVLLCRWAVYNFTTDLDREFFFSDRAGKSDDIATKQEIDEAIASALSFINASTSNLQNNKKKLLKRYLISMLPYPYDFDQFVEYTSYLAGTIDDDFQKSEIALRLYENIICRAEDEAD